jgi:hypothetical protein
MNPVYETRIYHAGPGKMDALLSRFARHTDSLLQRHHLKPIAYWMEYRKGLLIYIIEHESVEAAERNWTEFQNDLEWQKVKTETDANGPLAATIERHFMEKVDLAKFA